MRFLLALVIVSIILIGCEDSQAKPFNETPLLETSSVMIPRYKLTHQAGMSFHSIIVGVSKYSGLKGTYTAKHSPVAVSCSLDSWAVYSENSDGDLSIYAPT